MKPVNRRLILAALGGFAVAPAMNMAVDPFGVLGATWWPRQTPSLNERVWKVRLLLSLPKAHDVLLMGSSVTDMASTQPAQDLLGLTVFNASVFAGTPASSFALLRVLAKHQRLPKQVILGLEPLAFHDPDHGDLSTRDHWESSGQRDANALLPYLFSFSATELAGRLMAQSGDIADVRWDAISGQCLLDRYEAEISRDPHAFESAHLASAPSGLSNTRLLTERFEALARLRAFTQAHGIKLLAFASPLPPVVRRGYEPSVLASFFEGASKALGSPLVDLSGLLDAEAHPWYDFRHYRPRYTDRVMRHVLQA